MLNFLSVKDAVSEKRQDSKYFLMPFYLNGKTIESGKKWGMTLLAADSMRFRWNEQHERRTQMLFKVARDNRIKPCPGDCAEPGKKCDCKAKPVSLELIHSKIVYELKDGTETYQKQGDGMITDNLLLMPVVTVADCVPIFFYDSVNNVFGVVHSGWKGTGIIGDAIKTAVEKYGCNVKNISVAIGPHIGDCCYDVYGERVEYFLNNFGLKTITEKTENNEKKYMLSLTEANLSVLRNAGVPEENIVVATDCTCCTKFGDGTNVFGSFRRQAAFLPGEMTTEERSKKMTVQAAFVI